MEVPTRRSRPISRRQLLRAAGTVTAGAWLAPDRLFAAILRAPHLPQAAVDQLTAMRNQMGAAPVQLTKLTDMAALLAGPGGNLVVLHGSDGKVVIDTFVQPAWPNLQKSLAGLGAAPVKTVVNTHWHFDHADNNANFAAAGSAIVAHENTKKRLSESHDLLGMKIAPAPPAALPTQTFTTTHTIDASGEQLALAAVPPAHTDTDIFIHLTKANVLHMGDVFFNGMYPFIDAGTRGNINGMIDGAERGLKMADATTKIVPGHGPLADRGALTKYRDVLATIRDRVQKLKTAGASLAEVQAAKPGAEFDATWGAGMMAPNDFVGIVYNTL